MRRNNKMKHFTYFKQLFKCFYVNICHLINQAKFNVHRPKKINKLTVIEIRASPKVTQFIIYLKRTNNFSNLSYTFTAGVFRVLTNLKTQRVQSLFLTQMMV